MHFERAPSEMVSTRTLIAVCISDFDSLARPVRNPALKYQVPRFTHVRRVESANLRSLCIFYACAGGDKELTYRSGQSPQSGRKYKSPRRFESFAGASSASLKDRSKIPIRPSVHPSKILCISDSRRIYQMHPRWRNWPWTHG